MVQNRQPGQQIYYNVFVEQMDKHGQPSTIAIRSGDNLLEWGNTCNTIMYFVMIDCWLCKKSNMLCSLSVLRSF
jgi:hypothetical protein